MKRQGRRIGEGKAPAERVRDTWLGGSLALPSFSVEVVLFTGCLVPGLHRTL